MDFGDVLRRRRMVRSFAPGRPVAPEVLDRVLAAATRAPSAGFAQGTELVVLEGEEETGRFWELTAPPAAVARPDPWPGLRLAPVVVLPMASPDPYLHRYAESDKAALGRARVDAWPVPYWEVDCAFATMLLLLAAVDEGLGAAFVGIFSGEAELLAHLGVPDGWRPLGAVALGHPGDDLRPSASASRPRRRLADVGHRGHW